jgi:APA family basic amino acid/polyamine antiporter
VAAVFVAIKIVVILLLVVMGVSYIKQSNYVPFIPPSSDEAVASGSTVLSSILPVHQASYGVLGIFSGATMVFLSFVGADNVISVSEETKNPKKNLPLGIFAAIAVTTILYILVSLTITGMVPYTELKNSASTPSLATAFELVGAGVATKIIAVGSLVALSTVIIVGIMLSARVMFSISRDGFIPDVFSKVTKRTKVPKNAQLFATLIVIIFATLSDPNTSGQFVNVASLILFLSVSVSLLVIRAREKRNPDFVSDKSSFRVPLGPVIPVATILFCTWLLLNAAVVAWVNYLVLLLVGCVIYFVYGKRGVARKQSDTERETEHNT